MLNDLESIQLGNGIVLYAAGYSLSPLITVEGSFRTAPDVVGGELLLQRLTTAMLDKGMLMSKQETPDRQLERMGMEWRFESDQCRIRFRGRIMGDCFEAAVEAWAEQLRYPTFDMEEFARQKALLAEQLKMEAEDASEGAGTLLLRTLYPPGHPRHVPELHDCLAFLGRLEVGQVRDYHRKNFGTDGMIIVVIGGLAPERMARVFNAHLGTWGAHGRTPHLDRAAHDQTTDYVEKPMDGNGLCSIAMGHGLPLRHEDADYLPLYAALHMLGGNSSSRLQMTVRNRDGLVYRIGAQLAPPMDRCDGHWQVSLVQMSDHRYEAMEAARREVHRFVLDGPTETEFAEKMQSIPGAALVRMANTSEMASALVECLEQGFDVEYLRNSGKYLRNLSMKDINRTIRRYLHPGKMCIAVAGAVC